MPAELIEQTFTFEEVCAISVALTDLAHDPDLPIYFEGDIRTEVSDDIDWERMYPGEAARIAVMTVLQHPILQGAFAERERLWGALKWAVANCSNVPPPPDEHRPAIDAAIDAGFEDLPPT